MGTTTIVNKAAFAVTRQSSDTQEDVQAVTCATGRPENGMEAVLEKKEENGDEPRVVDTHNSKSESLEHDQKVRTEPLHGSNDTIPTEQQQAVSNTG
jgi:hypothetical protein